MWKLGFGDSFFESMYVCDEKEDEDNDHVVPAAMIATVTVLEDETIATMQRGNL